MLRSVNFFHHWLVKNKTFFICTGNGEVKILHCADARCTPCPGRAPSGSSGPGSVTLGRYLPGQMRSNVVKFAILAASVIKRKRYILEIFLCLTLDRKFRRLRWWKWKRYVKIYLFDSFLVPNYWKFSYLLAALNCLFFFLWFAVCLRPSSSSL